MEWLVLAVSVSHVHGCLWKGLEGLITSPTSRAALFPPILQAGDLEWPWPAPARSPSFFFSTEKGSHQVTHFVSSESGPQSKLPIPLQEADFHVVDSVPMKYHQHVGFCAGLRRAVSDQEHAVLKERKSDHSSGCQPSCPRPTLPSWKRRLCSRFPDGFSFG